MLRFLIISLLALSSIPASIRAEELTSFDSNGRSYNLLIFNKFEFREPVSHTQSALQSVHDNSEITECSIVIDVPVGVVGGNHSYGGVCKLKTDEDSRPILNTMICADEMVGHFAFSQLTDSDASVESLAEFVARSCYGG